MNKKIEIFDPAMCCSTGICGPSVNENLLRVATLINSLANKGIIIKRFGLSSDPQAFVDNKIINYLFEKLRLLWKYKQVVCYQDLLFRNMT